MTLNELITYATLMREEDDAGELRVCCIGEGLIVIDDAGVSVIPANRNKDVFADESELIVLLTECTDV